MAILEATYKTNRGETRFQTNTFKQFSDFPQPLQTFLMFSRQICYAICNQAVAFIMMSTQAFHQSVSCFDAFKIIIFMIFYNLHSHWCDFLHFSCPIQNLLGLRSCKGTKHEQQSSMVKLVVTISPHQIFLLTWYQ